MGNTYIPLDARGKVKRGTAYDFSVTATDNFDLAPVITCAPPSGSVFTVGVATPGSPITATINCTAVDQAGNSTDGSFTVTVRDTRPPHPSGFPLPRE